MVKMWMCIFDTVILELGRCPDPRISHDKALVCLAILNRPAEGSHKNESIVLCGSGIYCESNWVWLLPMFAW